MTDTILFGKYRLERMIGTGRTGTVWLAVHLGLSEYRAIKCIPKETGDYQTIRREALILKELRHPAIPLIYDLEEDPNFLYLIQEHLKGVSLYTLMERQGVLQEAEAVSYGIQLCRLVEFLHLAGEKPILFLDLQPKNIIICNGTVKLVDFGGAFYEEELTSQSPRYGTRGFAAPEQYTADQKLDVRTDLYAIGAVLAYMLTGKTGWEQLPPGISLPLGQIISRCMEEEAGKRFASAREVRQRLEGLLPAQQLSHSTQPENRPSLTIFVTGVCPGAGATCLSLALCSRLTALGFHALYEEHNSSGHMRRLAEYEQARADEAGIYSIRGCRIKPWYGGAVRFADSCPEVRVCDYGVNQRELLQDLEKTAAQILVCTGVNSWHRDGCQQILMNLFSLQAEKNGGEIVLLFRAPKWPDWLRELAAPYGKRGLRCFREPDFYDPFKPEQEGNMFLDQLWKSLSGKERKGSWFAPWEFVRKAAAVIMRR